MGGGKLINRIIRKKKDPKIKQQEKIQKRPILTFQTFYLQEGEMQRVHK